MATSMLVKILVLVALGASLWNRNLRKPSAVESPLAPKGVASASRPQITRVAELCAWACIVCGIFGELMYGIFWSMDPPILSPLVLSVCQVGGYV